MIRATHIRSLTDFTRNAKAYIQRIKDSKSPMALTVNGNAEVVVQDAASYQEMVDELEHSRFIAAMRESERAVKEGRFKDAKTSLADVRSKLGI